MSLYLLCFVTPVSTCPPIEMRVVLKERYIVAYMPYSQFIVDWCNIQNKRYTRYHSPVWAIDKTKCRLLSRHKRNQRVWCVPGFLQLWPSSLSESVIRAHDCDKVRRSSSQRQMGKLYWRRTALDRLAGTDFIAFTSCARHRFHSLAKTTQRQI